MHVGKGKPQWSFILQKVRCQDCQLERGANIDGRKIYLRVVALTADMPAKASVCNIQSFNSK